MHCPLFYSLLIISLFNLPLGEANESKLIDQTFLSDSKAQIYLHRLLSGDCPPCGENMDCDTNTQQCECKIGFFGSDCSISAILVPSENAMMNVLQPLSWTYFYINIGDGKQHEFTLEFESGPLEAAFLWKEHQNQLPPTRGNGYVYLDSPPDSKLWRLSIEGIEAHKNEILLFALYNPQTKVVQIGVQPKAEKNQTLVIILIAIGAVSIVVNVGGCIYFLKYKLRRELLAAMRPQTERVLANDDGFTAIQLGSNYGNTMTIRVGLNLNNNVDRTQVIDLEASLTHEDLNMYFPQTQFQELKSPFSQVECPICLEEFPPDIMCRQLYCGHIYHTRCIQLWLAKHKACPNCKKGMTRMTIGQFYAMKKLAEKEVELNNENNDLQIIIEQQENIVDSEPKNQEEERDLEEIRRMLEQNQGNEEERVDVEIINLEEAEAILQKSVLEKSEDSKENENEDNQGQSSIKNNSQSGESEEALNEEEIVDLEVNSEENRIGENYKTPKSSQEEIDS